MPIVRTTTPSAAAAASGAAGKNLPKQGDFAFVAKIVDAVPIVRQDRKDLINADLALKKHAKLPAAQRAPYEAKLRAAATKLNKDQFAMLSKMNTSKLTAPQKTAQSALLHAMRINPSLLSDADGTLRDGSTLTKLATGTGSAAAPLKLWDKYAVYN